MSSKFVQCSLVLAFLITSSLILNTNRHVLHEARTMTRRTDCNGILGNPDLYGLGIRVGIYLQWISSLLTIIFLPVGVSDSLDTNSIFVFSVVIAVAKATTSLNHLRPMEAVIMLQMRFEYLLTVLSVSGLRITLLSDPNRFHPDLWLSELRRSPHINMSNFRHPTKHLSDVFGTVYLERIRTQ